MAAWFFLTTTINKALKRMTDYNMRGVAKTT